MMHWGYMGSGGVMMALVWVVGLLLFVGLVATVAIALQPTRRQASAPQSTPEPASPAEAELDLRYARGQIDAATLAQQRAVLRQR